MGLSGDTSLAVDISLSAKLAKNSAVPEVSAGSNDVRVLSNTGVLSMLGLAMGDSRSTPHCFLARGAVLELGARRFLLVLLPPVDVDCFILFGLGRSVMSVKLMTSPISWLEVGCTTMKWLAQNCKGVSGKDGR